ncbi:hypothetical protein ABZ690_36545, partial [Streptomyces sp. NPDC006967]|uniref:hypothetical protein n=1 Tax=Streptomyces sp. NPDC006967 TaxID=3156906 RepID=UPI0033C42BFA
MTERTETPATRTGSYRTGPQGLAYKALLEHTQMCEPCVAVCALDSLGPYSGALRLGHTREFAGLRFSRG